LSRLSVVMVTYHSGRALERTLPALVPQLRPGDELVVVDNASGDDTLAVLARLAPDALFRSNPANEGFAAGANAGAALATGDLLVLLNPDAAPSEGFAEAIRRPIEEEPRWAAWMGLVTMDGGRHVNTAGGVVHFTGIAWAGRWGMPVGALSATPAEVGFVSGACLAIPRATFLAHGGFPSSYFMYCEDVDLSLRLRLAGGRLGIEPAARVDHDYAFMRDRAKWRMLERNRWATVLRTYPGPLLALVLPALLATELALAVVARRGGWGGEKRRAAADVLVALPRLLAERRAIQAARRVRAAEFAAALSPELSSPFLGLVGRVKPLRLVLRLYWAGVRALLGRIERV